MVTQIDGSGVAADVWQGEEATTQHKRSFVKKILRMVHHRPLRALLLLVILAACVATLYVAGYRLTQGVAPWASSEERAQAELAAVVAALGELMFVPSGEPLLATVQDAEALKSQQPFFQNAVNGDQLLMFPESAQAVLYSPSRGIIVNVGPIRYDDTSAAQKSSVLNTTTQELSKTASSEAVSAPVTVEVRNGSGIDGQGALIAGRIEASSEYPYSITAVTDAHTADYTKTVIVDMTRDAKNGGAIQALAKLTGATAIEDLPGGEAASSADVIIILGNE